MISQYIKSYLSDCVTNMASHCTFNVAHNGIFRGCEILVGRRKSYHSLYAQLLWDFVQNKGPLDLKPSLFQLVALIYRDKNTYFSDPYLICAIMVTLLSFFSYSGRLHCLSVCILNEVTNFDLTVVLVHWQNGQHSYLHNLQLSYAIKISKVLMNTVFLLHRQQKFLPLEILFFDSLHNSW